MATALGASYLGEGECRFEVWAPHAETIDLHIIAPEDRFVPMQKGERGYYIVTVDARAGLLYKYRLDGDGEYPDPASRHQPEGVFGPSEVIADAFDWQDGDWQGLPVRGYVIYELHVGTFSREGTFDGVVPYLPYFQRLGITAVEIMPVAQFPGDRNWGYDGVFPYAAQNSYGGPDGLKRLVDACHRHNIAVMLDVVYNHLGPEGNVLGAFGPYFTDKIPYAMGQSPQLRWRV